MNEIIQSDTFHQWLNGLKDQHACMRIYARLDRVRLGNFGDMAPMGEGLSELSIHFGPGYRIYFVQRDNKVVLLCGGYRLPSSGTLQRRR